MTDLQNMLNQNIKVVSITPTPPDVRSWKGKFRVWRNNENKFS